jgi:hypothetical protein
MSDIASDHDAAIMLIVEEYQRLQKHNPNHELLKYITKVGCTGFENKREYMYEFLNKYSKKENEYWACVLTRYYVDLRNAVDKIERIDRSPKPKISQ